MELSKGGRGHIRSFKQITLIPFVDNSIFNMLLNFAARCSTCLHHRVLYSELYQKQLTVFVEKQATPLQTTAAIIMSADIIILAAV